MRLKYTLSDEIIDHQAIAKKFGIPGTFKPNVETHLVRLGVENWPASLTNLIRNAVSFIYPTKRIHPTLIECTDSKLIIEPVLIKISYIKLAHDCPTSSFVYSVVHDEKYDEPKVITMADSPIGKYMNPGRLCPIEKGKKLVLQCDIVESTNVASKSYHLFASKFDRTKLEEVEGPTPELIYNTGEILIRYNDNISGEDMFTNVKKILGDYFTHILDNFDKYYKVKIVTPYLIVPNDRAGLIANCISVYVYHIDNSKFAISVKNNTTIIQYPENTEVEMKVSIIKALTTLKSLFV
jgi:hypothetical protein